MRLPIVAGLLSAAGADFCPSTAYAEACLACPAGSARAPAATLASALAGGGNATATACECPPRTYRRPGGGCGPCRRGATCAGGDAPARAAKHHALREPHPATDAVATFRCHASRRCSPSPTGCADARRGPLCSRPGKGRWVLGRAASVPCPPGAVRALVPLAMLGLLAVLAVLAVRWPVLVSLVDALQCASVVSRLVVGWPSSLEPLFSVCDAFLFDARFAAAHSCGGHTLAACGHYAPLVLPLAALVAVGGFTVTVSDGGNRPSLTSSRLAAVLRLSAAGVALHLTEAAWCAPSRSTVGDGLRFFHHPAAECGDGSAAPLLAVAAHLLILCGGPVVYAASVGCGGRAVSTGWPAGFYRPAWSRFELARLTRILALAALAVVPGLRRAPKAQASAALAVAAAYGAAAAHLKPFADPAAARFDGAAGAAVCLTAAAAALCAGATAPLDGRRGRRLAGPAVSAALTLTFAALAAAVARDGLRRARDSALRAKALHKAAEAVKRDTSGFGLRSVCATLVETAGIGRGLGLDPAVGPSVVVHLEADAAPGGLNVGVTRLDPVSLQPIARCADHWFTPTSRTVTVRVAVYVANAYTRADPTAAAPVRAGAVAIALDKQAPAVVDTWVMLRPAGKVRLHVKYRVPYSAAQLSLLEHVSASSEARAAAAKASNSHAVELEAAGAPLVGGAAFATGEALWRFAAGRARIGSHFHDLMVGFVAPWNAYLEASAPWESSLRIDLCARLLQACPRLLDCMLGDDREAVDSAVSVLQECAGARRDVVRRCFTGPDGAATALLALIDPQELRVGAGARRGMCAFVRSAGGLPAMVAEEKTVPVEEARGQSRGSSPAPSTSSPTAFGTETRGNSFQGTMAAQGTTGGTQISSSSSSGSNMATVAAATAATYEGLLGAAQVASLRAMYAGLMEEEVRLQKEQERAKQSGQALSPHMLRQEKDKPEDGRRAGLAPETVRPLVRKLYRSHPEGRLEDWSKRLLAAAAGSGKIDERAFLLLVSDLVEMGAGPAMTASGAAAVAPVTLAQVPSVFSKHELARLHADFDAFDLDDSGTVDAGELQKALASFGLAVPLNKIERIVAEYSENDDDESGLDFAAFLVMLANERWMLERNPPAAAEEEQREGSPTGAAQTVAVVAVVHEEQAEPQAPMWWWAS